MVSSADGRGFKSLNFVKLPLALKHLGGALLLKIQDSLAMPQIFLKLTHIVTPLVIIFMINQAAIPLLHPIFKLPLINIPIIPDNAADAVGLLMFFIQNLPLVLVIYLLESAVKKVLVNDLVG